MGKDTVIDPDGNGGNDSGDNRGSSGSAESDDGLRIVVGDGDDVGGNGGGSSSGDGSGDGGSGGGSGIQSAGSRRERSARNKQRHAETGSGARKAPLKKSAAKKATPVGVRERRASASKEKTSAIPAPALGELVNTVFTLTAVRKGDHWRLHPEEKEAIGDALANVMRHVPLPEKELGIAAEIAALGYTSYAIVMPRLEYDRHLLAQKQGTARMPAPAARRPVAVPDPAPAAAPAPEPAESPVQAPEPVTIGGGDGTALPMTESEIYAGSTDPSVISRLPIG